MPNNQVTNINKLHELLANTKEAVKGYNHAADHLENKQVKDFFLRKADRRSVFATEIETAIRTIGGTVKETGQQAGGILHRAWMDIRTALSQNDRNALLDECRRGEETCLDDYKDILADQSLPSSCRNVLTRQYDELLQDINSYKVLKQ